MKLLPSLLLTGAGLAAAAGGLWTIYTEGRDRPATSAPLTSLPATGHRPLLVELYQSQGCSSCPPANANLNLIADRPDVVALSFAVTYWDRFGWKDRFAMPQFTQRQVAYSRSHPEAVVATPQMWINGRRTIVGSDPRQLAQVIARGDDHAGPTIRLSSAAADIGAGSAPAERADVWLAEYDPRTIDVAVGAGENRGRTLPHKNIVRRLTHIGQWSGAAVHLALPPPDATLRRAIFIQAGEGGPILAAAKS